MMVEKYVVQGLASLPLSPNQSFVETIYNSLQQNSSEHKAMINAATGESISYQELFAQSRKLAEALKRAGVMQHDAILICTENSLYFFQILIAALYIGAVTAPINHLYTIGEIIGAVSISKPKIIFCSKNCFDKMVQVKQHASHIEKIIMIDSTKCDTESLNAFMNFEKDSDFKRILPLTDVSMNEHLALILCSSGTTGLPKGVMITHNNLYAQMLQMKDPLLFVQCKAYSPFSIFPFSSIAGIVFGLSTILKSQQFIFLPKFNETLYLETIQKYRPTCLLYVPTIAFFLAATDLLSQYDLSSVREVKCGGAKLPQEVEDIVKQRLNISLSRQMYGSTETLLTVMMPLNENRPGSLGKVVPNMQAKVIDIKTQEELRPNEKGELCFKGNLIMKGYVNDIKATTASIDQDGWYHTGDVGYYDEDEYFYITDRLKELIKYNAYQVSPEELEDILKMHPEIKDAGVVGLPDDSAGELPLAFVVQQPDAKLTENEIQDFVAEQVSPQKRLRGGVVFVDKLPRNAMGKLIRWKLREQLTKLKPTQHKYVIST